MQRLEDLLNRIKWDPTFGRGGFALGYQDRLLGTERVVPVTAITIGPDRPGTFSVQDDGIARHIPLHRVRTVYKDGTPIWQRRTPTIPDR